MTKSDDIPWQLGELGESGRRMLKTSEVLARELANHIVRNDLPEGTRLPSEKEMVAACQVGRTTLREALRLLEARGVLRVRAGRDGGPVVRRPHLHELSESLTLILQFEKAPLSEVLLAREALAPMIARLAAANITQAQTEALEGASKVLDSDVHVADPGAWLEAYRSYMSTMAEASGNVVLRTFSETLESIAFAAFAATHGAPANYRFAAGQVRDVVESVTRGDPDAAALAARAHVAEVTAYWRQRYSAIYESPVSWNQ